jgi:hypothetical protein
MSQTLRLPGLDLVPKSFFLVVASWLSVHFLAIFGVFLAAAYPLWWLLAPKRTVCLLCRATKENSRCPFCHRFIKKNEEISPSGFSSAALNGLLILGFSIISAGIVFGESQLLFKLGFPPTPKTATFSIPTKGQYRLGEIFPVKIEITGIEVPVNAVQADLGFDPGKLEVVDISTTDSFANIFIQEEINNEGGYARLTGGLPNPGFFSDKGVFGTVFFKAKEPGLVQIEFLPSSMILANDSRGSNVLKELAAASYLILPEKITEEEAKMQQQLSFKPPVLGETETTTQMKFYDEAQVLGAEAVGLEREAEQPPLVTETLEKLEAFDQFTVRQWQKALALIAD